MTTTETRPTGEQLRFVSEATGEHILDDYLEAAEKGGRTLADLLADLFNTSGLLREDIFQFRVTTDTRELQFRSGDHVEPEEGWTTFDNGTLINWRGTYATATAYKQTDLVKHNDSIYICVQEHTSSSPAPNASFALMIYAEDIRGPIANVAASVNFVIDGGDLVLTPGFKGSVSVPFACTISEYTLLADQTGSIEIDIQKSSYANFPITTSIVASAPPTLTAARKATSSTLTGWTTAISANDILTFTVNSVTSIQRATISLKVART